jgi:hypothetical protein
MTENGLKLPLRKNYKNLLPREARSAMLAVSPETKGVEMPTELPSRQEFPIEPPRRDPGFRDLLIAATVLLSILCLISERAYGPLPGYSLVENAGDLQLSP